MSGKEPFGGGSLTRYLGLSKIPLECADPLNGSISSLLDAGDNKRFPNIEPVLHIGCAGRSKIEVKIGGFLAQK
jgi:hypothetical protein